VFDLSGGIGKDSWTLEMFIKNLSNEDAPMGISVECAVSFCGAQPYGIRMVPRTIGVRFEQKF
jgi:hypothetical protein